MTYTVKAITVTTDDDGREKREVKEAGRVVALCNFQWLVEWWGLEWQRDFSAKGGGTGYDPSTGTTLALA